MVETVLRVLLGVVLAGAALAKLNSPRESIAALDSFGFGEGPMRPIAWAALIAIELALAVGVALLGCAGLGIAVLALAREVGMLRLQVGTQGALEIAGEGPEIGSLATDLAARISRNGADLRLAVFTSEGCHICQTLVPAI